MTRNQAEQAIGSEVWTTYTPKLVKSRWLSGPYKFEKITKGGMALLTEPPHCRGRLFEHLTLALSTIHSRETALAMCPPFTFYDEALQASAPVEERQPLM